MDGACNSAEGIEYGAKLHFGRRSIEEMQKRAQKGNQLFQMCSCALTLLCSGCIESENNNRVDAEHERQMESKDFKQLFRLCFARWRSAVLNMEQGCTGRRSIEEMQST